MRGWSWFGLREWWEFGAGVRGERLVGIDATEYGSRFTSDPGVPGWTGPVSPGAAGRSVARGARRTLDPPREYADGP
ncbi:hypothetical protein J2S53_000011 [Actinopolyspora lacussalsi]|nr:hypothetical protein [Actinopolyspora lacussalsi]